MEDTVKSDRTTVLDIARLLEDHRGENTCVLYVGETNDWTDYFIISTVRGHTHQTGILRTLNEYFSTHGLKPLNPHKNVKDNGWIIIDCGSFVVHLMEKEQRDFYELEKLWFKAELLIHSSKSS